MTEAEKHLLQKELSFCKFYLEFGSGESTITACKMENIQQIVCVESDPSFWKKNIESTDECTEALNNKRLRYLPIDIGETISWGYPVNEDKKELWDNYWMKPYTLEIPYDLILIDGRFRINCALQACYYSAMNTRILIHDYTIRPYYFIISYFLEIVEVVDTLTLFTIKKEVNKELLRLMIDCYKHNPL